MILIDWSSVRFNQLFKFFFYILIGFIIFHLKVMYLCLDTPNHLHTNYFIAIDRNDTTELERIESTECS